MRILVVADIHGDLEKLEKLGGGINHEEFDLAVCPGDFTDMFSIPAEFSQQDIAEMVIQKLKALKIPLMCVPGNHDPYEIVDYFEDYKINLHGKKRKFHGMDIIGWGGALTPFNTLFEPTDEETNNVLNSLVRGSKPNSFILVTHDPPKDTNVDAASSGMHVGSPVIRKFIEKNQPLVALSAHIHESPGTDKIGETTLFYPGAVFNNNYGVIEISNGEVRCQRKTF